MIFNQHSELSGKHAFLSPSTSSWVRYDEQKLAARFSAAMGSRRGTALHEFARQAIELRIKLAKRGNPGLAAYVADGIGYQMNCEQSLFYSDNCFGTADAICFWDNLLRIHDLKTGITKSSMEQLEVYAALFCLEYGLSPFEIQIELRIYEREERVDSIPDPETILFIMDKIMEHDLVLQRIREEPR